MILSTNSNSILTQSISALIDSQLPEFIVSNNPNFGAFLKAYYQWLEQANSGAVLYHTKNLLNYKDIDQTTDAFIKYFVNDFLPFFPPEIALDRRKMVKVAREFYSTKGSEESIKFLFRVLYNLDAEVYFPKEHILKASDGKWQIPQAIKTYVVPGLDPNLFTQRVGTGSVSYATCTIEGATITIDPLVGDEIFEIFISNLQGTFSPEDYLIISGTYSEANIAFPKLQIISFVSGVTIDPNNQGLRYKVGDPVTFIDGLGTSSNAQTAKAVVSNVSTGSVSPQSTHVSYGGIGYSLYPNTKINVIGESTATANIIVQTINPSSPINLNIDNIENFSSVLINSTNYGFANISVSNSSTTLANAFSYEEFNIGALTQVTVVDPGNGYSQAPTFDIESEFFTNDSANSSNTVQFIKDYGYVANVIIINGGSGYDPAKDTIIVNSEVGYGASFSFTVDGFGSINSITIVTPGEGYVYPLGKTSPLILANSANTQNAASGSGAKLVANTYGEGAVIFAGVSQIGQIQAFEMTSKGSDYLTTPNVSVRIIDITTQNTQYELVSNFNPKLADGSLLYQGSSLAANTFTARLDLSGSYAYNLISNGSLRLYNYTGFYNVAAPLIAAGGTIVPNTTFKKYGDGTARANSNFLTPITYYPGYFLNTDGQPSSDQYLQDSVKYHNYSYILQVEKSLYDYKDTLMQIIHPTGMTILADMVILGVDDSRIQTQNVFAAIPPNCLGTATVNAFSSNFVVSGFNTNFTQTTAVNDLIVLNYANPSRIQSKLITSISNDTSLNVESNTVLMGLNTITTKNGSPILKLSSNNLGNVVVGDSIAFNIGTTIVANVINAPYDNNMITIDRTIGSNNANVVYFVYPNISNVSYIIVKQTNPLAYNVNQLIEFIDASNLQMHFANSTTINTSGEVYNFISAF